MKKKIAIFLYDFTGIMAQPWLDAGYECWLFDGQHEPGIYRIGNLVRVGMWFYHDQTDAHAQYITDLVGGHADFIFAFPECTDLTNAGSKHWAKKLDANPEFWNEAVSLARLVEKVADKCGCDKWGAENPVGKLSTLWRKPDFWFDPCDFGGYLPEDDAHPVYSDVYPPRDAYNKKTGIWCGSGLKKPEMMRVEPKDKANPGWAKCGGKSTRTKNIRSSTPRGFSIAMFEANS